MYSVLAVLLFCSSIPVFPVNWKLNIESWLDSGLFSIGTFHRGALYFPFDHIRKHIFYVFNRNILWQIVYLKGYIWNLEKWYWWTNLQGRNRDADTENRLLDIQGKERVGWFERVALRHIFYHMWDRDDWDDCVPCAKSFQSSPTLCDPVSPLSVEFSRQEYWSGLVVKNLHYQCKRHKRCGFDPQVGKIPWRRKWQPTPVFLPGESHIQRRLVGYSPWGCKELDTTERLSIQVKQITSGKFHITQGSQPGPLWRPRGVGWSGDGREVQEGGDICILMTDSCCMAETSTIF